MPGPASLGRHWYKKRPPGVPGGPSQGGNATGRHASAAKGICEETAGMQAASGPLRQLLSWAGSTAASEPAFSHRVAGLLAFAEELHIGHDRLTRMVGPPMRDVGFVIGNADHQTRRSRR